MTKMPKSLKFCAHTMVSAAALMSAAPAYAQAAPDSDDATEETEARGSGSIFDGEIVVRAQKRDQLSQDVGIAITTFTGEQIERLGFESAADVANLAPNVNVRRHFITRGQTTNLFVRGVGQTNFNNATEGSVAGYVDDFYLPTSSTLDFLLFDMERAEVLRGPQGTLFGRNATGGAFQYFTAKPELGEVSGQLKLGLGNFSKRLYEGHINVPLGDNAAVRVAAHRDTNSATTRNLFPGKEDAFSAEFEGIRAQILFEPSDDLRIIVKGESGKTSGNIVGDHGRSFDLLDTLEGQGEVVEVPVDAFGYNASELPTTPDQFSANGGNSGFNKIDHLLGRVEYDFGNMTLTSITGWIDQDYVLIEDCDGSPTPFCNFQPTFASESFSQELRLQGETDNLTWSVGGYFLNSEATADTIVPVLVGLTGAPPSSPDRLDALSLLINFDQELRSMALFGQVEFDISDKITLIAGLRLNNDRKDFEQILRFATIEYLSTDPNFDTVFDIRNFVVTGDAAPPNVFTREEVGDLTRLDETSIGGTAQINFKPSDDALIYASIRRGIKGGGFDNEVMPVSLPADQIPYTQETLLAYELGAKITTDTIFRTINSAVFYYDYDDFQAVSFENFGNFQQNADARVYGAEIEVYGRAGPVDFIFGGSYLDTKVFDIRRPGGFVLDTELGEAPKWSANWLLRYTAAIDSLDGELVFQTNGRYSDRRFGDVLNQEGLALDSFIEVDGLISFTPYDGDWNIDFWAKNIFDERYETYKLEIDNLAGTLNGQVNWNPARTYGASVTYRF